jgi:hypothetical protein
MRTSRASLELHSVTFSILFTALLGLFAALALTGCDNDDPDVDAGPDLSAGDLLCGAGCSPDLRQPPNLDLGDTD